MGRINKELLTISIKSILNDFTTHIRVSDIEWARDFDRSVNFDKTANGWGNYICRNYDADDKNPHSNIYKLNDNFISFISAHLKQSTISKYNIYVAIVTDFDKNNISVINLSYWAEKQENAEYLWGSL